MIIAMGRVSTRDSKAGPQLMSISAAHGGLLVSVIIFAVQQHFMSTLQTYDQPHTFNVEAVFLRPASAGEAVVEIKDVKLGISVSTVQFTLVQGNRERVVGHAS